MTEEELRELHHFEVEQENERLRVELNQVIQALMDKIAENVAAGLLIQKIVNARASHPECDVHPEQGPVTCGWKRVVQDIDEVLASGLGQEVRKGHNYE